MNKEAKQIVTQEELEKRWLGLRTTAIPTFIENPKYFKQTLDGKTKEDTAKFFELGTQTHMYLLESEEFKKTYTILDYTKPKGANQVKFCELYANKLIKQPDINKKDLCVESYKQSYKVDKKKEETITKEAVKLYNSLQEYIQFLTVSDKEVISFSTHKFLNEAKQCVINHKLGNKLIFEEEFSADEHFEETRVLWEFPLATYNDQPLVVKSTIDKMIINHETKTIKLVDLKTTNDISSFGEKFHKYNGYKIQLACYWNAIYTYFREHFPDKDINDYNKETYLVAIQTRNPYKDLPVNCEVFPIKESSLTEGLNILENTLPDIAWHFENDLWDHDRSYYEGDGTNKAL
jgi:hypothetical protein